MFHRIMAALCLLPASFIVFGREWFSALRLGPWYFFGKVIKAGPLLVRKRGRLFKPCGDETLGSMWLPTQSRPFAAQTFENG